MLRNDFNNISIYFSVSMCSTLDTSRDLTNAVYWRIREDISAKSLPFPQKFPDIARIKLRAMFWPFILLSNTTHKMFDLDALIPLFPRSNGTGDSARLFVNKTASDLAEKKRFTPVNFVRSLMYTHLCHVSLALNKTALSNSKEGTIYALVEDELQVFNSYIKLCWVQQTPLSECQSRVEQSEKSHPPTCMLPSERKPLTQQSILSPMPKALFLINSPPHPKHRIGHGIFDVYKSMLYFQGSFVTLRFINFILI